MRKKCWRCEGAKLLEEAHEKADDMTVKTLVIFSSVESDPPFLSSLDPPARFEDESKWHKGGEQSTSKPV